MENPIYREMAEDLETCIEELQQIVGVIKICDTHLKDDPDTALDTAYTMFEDTFVKVYKRLQALQIRVYKYKVYKNT